MNKTVTRETIKKYDSDGKLVEERITETTHEWEQISITDLPDITTPYPQNPIINPSITWSVNEVACDTASNAQIKG